jgi:hypothetical protein
VVQLACRGKWDRIRGAPDGRSNKFVSWPVSPLSLSLAEIENDACSYLLTHYFKGFAIVCYARVFILTPTFEFSLSPLRHLRQIGLLFGDFKGGVLQVGIFMLGLVIQDFEQFGQL